MKSQSVTSQTPPPSANTSHTGTLAANSDYDGADQRALGEAEMVVDQKMDVGDVRRSRDLVQKHPDHDRDIDGKHQAPGLFPQTQLHSAPGAAIGPTITCGAPDA